MCPPTPSVRRLAHLGLPDPLELLFWAGQGQLHAEPCASWALAALAAGLGTPEVEALAGLHWAAPSAQAEAALRAALRSLGAPEPTPERLALRHAAHLCAEALSAYTLEPSLHELRDLWDETRLAPLGRWKLLSDDLLEAYALGGALTGAVLADARAEMERWAGPLLQPA